MSVKKAKQGATSKAGGMFPMKSQLEEKGIGRRQALKNISIVFGTVSSMPVFSGLSAESIFAQGQAVHNHLSTGPANGSPATGLAVFNPHQNETVTVISELIIPQTNTPGAKAARVNEFIDVFLSSTILQERDQFLKGLDWIDRRSTELFQKPFIQATTTQQADLLTRISSEDSNEDSIGQIFFNRIKSLTVFGYYTSKVGLEEELKFSGWVEYKGCTHPEHQT